ncbi:hypothetical protein RI367_004896 [Sorochytrium milnesiophthora]
MPAAPDPTVVPESNTAQNSTEVALDDATSGTHTRSGGETGIDDKVDSRPANTPVTRSRSGATVRQRPRQQLVEGSDDEEPFAEDDDDEATTQGAGSSPPTGTSSVAATGPAKAFQCPTCPLSFSRLQNLKSHIQTHLGIKPFSCQVCGSLFARQHDLKRHERLHTGVRPFQCQVCHRCFSRQDALNRHQRGDCKAATGAPVSGQSLASEQPPSSNAQSEDGAGGSSRRASFATDTLTAVDEQREEQFTAARHDERMPPPTATSAAARRNSGVHSPHFETSRRTWPGDGYRETVTYSYSHAGPPNEHSGYTIHETYSFSSAQAPPAETGYTNHVSAAASPTDHAHWRRPATTTTYYSSSYGQSYKSATSAPEPSGGDTAYPLPAERQTALQVNEWLLPVDETAEARQSEQAGNHDIWQALSAARPGQHPPSVTEALRAEGGSLEHEQSEQEADANERGYSSDEMLQREYASRMERASHWVYGSHGVAADGSTSPPHTALSPRAAAESAMRHGGKQDARWHPYAAHYDQHARHRVTSAGHYGRQGHYYRQHQQAYPEPQAPQYPGTPATVDFGISRLLTPPIDASDAARSGYHPPQTYFGSVQHHRPQHPSASSHAPYPYSYETSHTDSSHQSATSSGMQHAHLYSHAHYDAHAQHRISWLEARNRQLEMRVNDLEHILWYARQQASHSSLPGPSQPPD